MTPAERGARNSDGDGKEEVRPPVRSLDDPEVIEAIEQYRKSLVGGERPDRAALIGRFPEIAEELASCLNAIDFLQPFTTQQSSALDMHGSTENRKSTETAAPIGMGTLGNYRLVRQIGCGGMGVVFEAEEMALGRRVALKVLPFAAALDPRHLQRFRNEAQAAASLDHPNIVSVYSVGSDRGIHYYAMKYVEGKTLAEMIAELRAMEEPNGGTVGAPVISEIAQDFHAGRFAPAGPSPDAAGIPVGARKPPASGRTGQGDGSSRGREYYRTVASWGAAAAEALDYAHQMGVIHRDIKPSNVMVDAQGRIWITDFGLAMTRAAGNLTATGDLLGTLRYMSPEQVQGNRDLIDQRSDIYSLGATLYEALTLHPAFEEENRESLLRDVLDKDPPALRTLVTTVPRDLETIVLKTLSKEPGTRYATAKDFAEDLRRFLEHKPIHAKRPGIINRVAKWARRHQGFSITLTAALFLASILGPIVAANQTRLRTKAEAETARAEANLKLALRAVDEVYTQLAEGPLTESPAAEPAKLAVLERAAMFYEQFADENPIDSRPSAELARAYRRLGHTYYWLGRFSEGEAAYRRSIDLFARLAPEQTDEGPFTYDLAEAQSSLGFLLYRVERLKEAEELYRVSLSGVQQAAMADSPSDDSVHLLAWIHNRLGVLLTRLERFAEAETELRAALALKEGLMAANPARAELRLSLGCCYHDLAALSERRQQQTDVGQFYQLAVQHKKTAFDRMPRNPEFRFQLAYSCAAHGRWLVSKERSGEAVEQWRNALAIYVRLSEDFPHIEEYRGHFRGCASLLAEHLRVAKQAGGAEGVWRAVVDSHERMIANGDASVSVFRGLAASYSALAETHDRAGNRPAAFAAIRKCTEFARQAAIQLPEDLDVQEDLGGAFQRHAEHCHGAERPDEYV